MLASSQLKIAVLYSFTVATRRGDMEILGYNLLQWLASKLPWENCLSDPVKVQQQKTQSMEDIAGLMKKSFPKSSPPG